MPNPLQEALASTGPSPLAPVPAPTVTPAPLGLAGARAGAAQGGGAPTPAPLAGTSAGQNRLLRALQEAVPQPPAAPSAAPRPIVEVPEAQPQREMSILEEAKNGFLGELGSAVQILRNVTDGAARLARRYSRFTGEPLADSLEKATDFFEQARQSLEPPPVAGQTTAERVVGKVVRGVAAMPVMVAEYGLATVALRNPLLAFAAVDAAREAHLGAASAAKAAAMGAATGGVLGAVGRIESAGIRAGLTGAAMGSAAAARGAPAEDVIAASLTGGLFGAVAGKPSRAVREAPPTSIRTPAEIISPESRIPGETPSPRSPVKVVGGVEIRGLDPTIPPFAAWWMSPHVWGRLVPEAKDAVYTAILAERHAARLQNKWASAAREVEISLDKASRDRLAKYLDDPQYTLERLPQDRPEVQAAFIKTRSLLNEIRDRVRKGKEEAGDYDPYGWGMEEGYFPHGARGYWRILSGGEPIPNGWIAQTQKEALGKVAEFKRLYPDAPDPVIEFGSPVAAAASAPGFGRSGRKYWGHAMAREAETPGLVGGFDSIYDYISGAARYSVYAPLRRRLLEARDAIEAAYPNSRLLKSWDDYMKQAEGVPDRATAALNDLLVEKFGAKPDAVQRALGFARGVQTLLKLGYSPVTALWNTFQVPVNTMPVLGPKWTMKGYTGFFENARTGKYNWLLDELGVRDAVTKADEMGIMQRLRLYAPRSLGEVPKFAWDQATALGMFLFSRAEYANRAVTVIGAYERARSMGLSREQAVRKALETEVRTQFSIGQADAMRVLANPWSRTAFQLRSFWAKQIEFMLGMGVKDVPGRFDSRRKELGRFLMATLAAGGIAAVPGAETLDSIVEKATGYSLLKKFWKKGPAEETVTYGIPTVLGADVSQNVGFGDWFTWRSLSDPYGPLVKDLRNLGQALAAPEGREKETAIRRFWRGASPEFRRIWDSYLGPAAQRGELLDVYGRPVVQGLTDREKALLFIGITPRRVAQERRTFSAEQQELIKKQSKERGYVDRAVKLIQQGRMQELDNLMREAEAEGVHISGESVRRRLSRVAQPRVELQRRAGRRYGIGQEETEGGEE